MRTRSMLAALMVAIVSVAAWGSRNDDEERGSGPDRGSNAPMLHFDAFNDDGGRFCVTCRAGQKPLAIVFATKDDDATRALISAVEAQRKAHDDGDLQTAIVLVEGHGADGLKSFIEEHDIKVAAGVVSPGDKDYKHWKINASVGSTTVLVKEHKVQASIANLEAEDLAEHVEHIAG